MQKIITHNGSANHDISFRANRKENYAPIIVESFIDDEGAKQHILESGNQMSDENYLKNWGKPKGVINWDLKYKGVNPDTTKLIYK